MQQQSNNSTIFVAPQGIDNGWANTNGQDLTFVDDMVRQIENGLCVDTTQLFAMGFSYGGGDELRLACARATVFRAVVVYSGGQPQRVQRRHPADRLLRHPRPPDSVLNISAGGRCATRSSATTAARPEPAGAGAGQPAPTSSPPTRAAGPATRWCGPRSTAGHTPGPVDGSAGSYDPAPDRGPRPRSGVHLPRSATAAADPAADQPALDQRRPRRHAGRTSRSSARQSGRCVDVPGARPPTAPRCSCGTATAAPASAGPTPRAGN